METTFSRLKAAITRAKTCFMLLFLVPCFFTGCASLPVPIEKEKSTVAITLDIDVHSQLLTYQTFKPEEVLYIRLDSKKDDLKKSEMFASGYSNCPFKPFGPCTDTFLLNVEPGFYAAVGAKGEAGTVITTILFPEEVIKSTVVEAKPDSIAYMGRYEFNSGSLFKTIFKDSPDDYQKHYYNLSLSAVGNLNGLVVAHRPLYLAVKQKEIFNSTVEEKKFLNKYKDKFKDVNLKRAIGNRLQEVDTSATH